MSDRNSRQDDWLDREGLLELGTGEETAAEVLRRHGVKGNDGRLCVPAHRAEDFIGIVEWERRWDP